jgi:hypothetical protein
MAVAVAAGVLGAAGCGSSGAGAGSGGGSAGAAANPAAPEVNPAGDIPDNQAYVPYTPAGAPFSVKVPEGWSRRSTGAAVTFTDKLNSIRIESARTGGTLTPAAARRTEVPALARSVKGFRLGKITTVHRKAGTAVEVTYLSEAAPNSVTGKAGTDAVERYVFAHNGSQVVLTLSGPKGADNVDPWRIVTDSLKWTR